MKQRDTKTTPRALRTLALGPIVGAVLLAGCNGHPQTTTTSTEAKHPASAGVRPLAPESLPHPATPTRPALRGAARSGVAASSSSPWVRPAAPAATSKPSPSTAAKPTAPATRRPKAPSSASDYGTYVAPTNTVLIGSTCTPDRAGPKAIWTIVWHWRVSGGIYANLGNAQSMTYTDNDTNGSARYINYTTTDAGMDPSGAEVPTPPPARADAVFDQIVAPVGEQPKTSTWRDRSWTRPDVAVSCRTR